MALAVWPEPMVRVIEGFRWSLAGQGDPAGRLLFISAGVVIVILLSGVAYFQKMETTVVDAV
jgi:lipopolysaccharide transport system permease protein